MTNHHKYGIPVDIISQILQSLYLIAYVQGNDNNLDLLYGTCYIPLRGDVHNMHTLGRNKFGGH